MRRGLGRGLAALLLLVSAHAHAAFTPAPLPPPRPWSGASEKLIAPARDPWITPAEAAGFATTPSYAETRAWLDRLAASCPLVRVETFGRTPQGRDLLVVTAGTPGPGKPVLLAQGGIHSGEIDGKDAGLMLLRDICHRGRAALVSNATFVFVPIFNLDGHERSGAFNRPNQVGPANQGWRTTSQNLNLNRDYLKADAPEMRAMLVLLARTNADLYLDLHVTDGHDQQYDLTISYNGFDGRYARSPAVGRWIDTRLRPAIFAGLTRAGHTPGRYLDAKDGRDPKNGVVDGFSSARYSTGYGDLRRVATVLVETHSLKPYRQRMLATRVLLEDALQTLAATGPELHAARAADRALRPASVVGAWKPMAALFETIDWLGIEADTYSSPAAGAPMPRWLGRPVTQRVQVWGDEPARTFPMPRAYWVPATEPATIARLAAHGVITAILAAPRTVAVEMDRLVAPKLATAVNEGHVEIAIEATRPEPRRETLPAGSVRVATDQPFGELAAMLLDARSSESLAAWRFYPHILHRTEYSRCARWPRDGGRALPSAHRSRRQPPARTTAPGAPARRPALPPARTPLSRQLQSATTGRYRAACQPPARR